MSRRSALPGGDASEPRPSLAHEFAPTRTNTSVTQPSRAMQMVRRASEQFVESRPAVGMFAAFGKVGSDIPSLADIEKGNYSNDGWSAFNQRRNNVLRRDSVQAVDVDTSPAVQEPTARTASTQLTPSAVEEKTAEGINEGTWTTQTEETGALTPHGPNFHYANGYQFPPKHTKKQAFQIALKGSWKFVITPFGALLTIYSLNIVAWGGMLFLILIRATPAMSHPSWNSWDSGAKTWLEIDSQILNALFCVTGLGLIPWRFRDFYYLLKWRYFGKTEEDRMNGLRRLAGIHNGWFRLKGSQNLDIHYNPIIDPIPTATPESALALPVSLSPPPPLTGERASPSTPWLLDFVIWAMVWNTFLQIVLCGLMWGLNKYNRPSWSVGLFISLACIVASAGGWIMFKEGRRVKGVEGVPVSEEDLRILREMRDKGDPFAQV